MRVDRVRVGKFEPFKGKNGRWYWRLWSANGSDVVADQGQGKGYVGRSGVVTAIKKVKLIVAGATIEGEV